MASVEMWLRPWARLDPTGERYRILGPEPVVKRLGSGPIWLSTDQPGGPQIAGKDNRGHYETTLADGRQIYAMPMPLRTGEGLVLAADGGSVKLQFPELFDCPDDRQEPVNDVQRAAKSLLDRVKSVWARLREVEAATADPYQIWETLARLWLQGDTPHDPEMDIIVRHARKLLATLDLLDRAPRRILRRTHQFIPLSRVQELDRKAMNWLVRQPGETFEERGGDRQRIRAVAREESFNTLENRVLLSYARLGRIVASDYCQRNRVASQSSRLNNVAAYGKRCRQLELDMVERGVTEANADVTPNFVLQTNPNYHRVWIAWRELLSRKRELDDLWRWQARSWDEFCTLLVIVALQTMPGIRTLATSPLMFRPEQLNGEFIAHVNPLAVFFHSSTGMTIEVQYRLRDADRAAFGAPIWLRIGGVDENGFLRRWPIWPIWDACGGLQSDEADEIQALLPAGRKLMVTGGLTLRPTLPHGSAECAITGAVGCLTVGASGEPLKRGIELLRQVLALFVLEGAT